MLSVHQLADPHLRSASSLGAALDGHQTFGGAGEILAPRKLKIKEEEEEQLSDIDHIGNDKSKEIQES